MIEWLRTSGTVTAANPAGINLLRRADTEIAADSLLSSTRVCEARLLSHITSDSSDEVSRKKGERRAERRRYYYSNEVLFLLWTEERFLAFFSFTFPVALRPDSHPRVSESLSGVRLGGGGIDYVARFFDVGGKGKVFEEKTLNLIRKLWR